MLLTLCTSGIASLATLLGSFLPTAPGGTAPNAVLGAANPSWSVPVDLGSDESFSSRDWTAKTADNICGLREPSQVSNPAVVQYKSLLDATAEMRKIKQDKIDPNSPEGIRLATNAASHVAQKCEELRLALGYCSVWKEIKHRDGRTVDDVTEKVKARL